MSIHFGTRPLSPLTALVPSSEGDAPRVLLAEDDPDLRELFEDALSAAGFSLASVKDGREALACFSSTSIGCLPCPDCIVLDVRMPEYTGFELLLALKLADWSVPVILITGFGSEEVHEKAHAYGCFAILDKPLKAEDLVAKVHEAIAIARSSTDAGAPRPLPMSFLGA